MPQGYNYKPISISPIINLGAKMDNRSNNEILNLDANNTGMIFYNLQNADLFNTKSLSTRLGTTDIGNGIINGNESPVSIYDLHNAPSGLTGNIEGQIKGGSFYDYWGLMIIPSGDQNIYSGTITIRGAESFLPTDGEIEVRMLLYKLDQRSYPASGVSFMSGTSAAPENILHDIALSGNYNVPPYPQYSPDAGTITTLLPLTQAVTDATIVNLGTYTFSGGSYYSEFQEIPWVFNAPYLMHSGSVYFLQNYIQVNSGTAANFHIQTYYSDHVDWSPNTSLGQEFFYFGAPANQANAIRSVGGPVKSWLNTNIYKHVQPSYMLVENPTAKWDFSVPLISGSFITAPDTTFQAGSLAQYGGSFNAATRTPIQNTDTPEFGQIITIPSGTWTLYGSYFYANTFSGVGGTNTQFYSRSKVPVNPQGYTVGYFNNLSRINSYSGTVSGSNYIITDRTILATYSGNHTFSNPVSSGNGYYQGLQFGPDHDLEKIYGLFYNPITVTNTSGTDYLLSFGFYNNVTGGKVTDFGYYNASPYIFFFSPFLTGMEQNLVNSGSFVYNKTGNDTRFQQLNTTALAGNDYDLTCGLIYVPSGNAITSVYDYRVGENRSQRVITTIRDQVRAFPLQQPDSQIVIHSGAQIGNNLKWSHSTYQNLLISHEYAQISGLVWDQLYSGTTNNFMQYHGQRPTFSAVEVSGVSGGITGQSGTSISIILATQMASGGIRSSDPLTFTFSGNGHSYVKLTGTDIFTPGFYPSGSQYAFDVLPQSTYVFTTLPSGSVYYLAGLVNVPNSGATTWPNPLPNSGTFVGTSGVFINDVSTTSLTQQVPNVINYDQNYLADQVVTPKFKKTIVYKDYVLGAGDPDNPSRLWYSEQFTANIYGTDGVFTGYVDIDLNNGSPITGMEIFKDYLIVFKYNSAYRLTPTGDPSIPFTVIQISTNIGSLGFFGTVSTDYGVFGLSQFGPFLATQAGADTIGDEIIPFFDTLDHTDLTFSVAIHDRLRQQIYWSITSQNASPDRNFGLVYSYAEKAWNIRVGGMWNAAGIIGDEDNFNLLYAGDNLGQLKQLSQGNADQDTIFNDGLGTTVTRAISLSGETPWMSMGNSQNLKQLRNIRINCDDSDQMLRIDVYTDQDSNVKYTRYISMNAPVLQRSANLSGYFRTVKFVLTTVGDPSPVKLNSLQISYQELGSRNQV